MTTNFHTTYTENYKPIQSNVSILRIAQLGMYELDKHASMHA